MKKKKSKIIIGNLLNTNQVNSGKTDVIFHFAGLSDLNKALTEPKQSIMLNILGTVNLLEAAKKFKIKRFIHASSILIVSKVGFIEVVKEQQKIMWKNTKKGLV